MVGHETVLGELADLADRGSLGHGYIFFGPDMVGKRTVARAIAERLESLAPAMMPPRQAASEAILVDYLEIGCPSGVSSIGIDAVREAQRFLWQMPGISPRRTLVIDDAHLMTVEAQNALLKIAEEPPASSLLILVASDPEGILATIRSRLPSIYFGTVSGGAIAEWLLTRDIEEKSARDAAMRAFGKPGLAIRLASDGELRGRLDLAARFLAAPAVSRRDVIKKIIEPEDFDFRRFLDAVVIILAWGIARGPGAKPPTAQERERWHRALRLYERETRFALNPRLQLEALML